MSRPHTLFKLPSDAGHPPRRMSRPDALARPTTQNRAISLPSPVFRSRFQETPSRLCRQGSVAIDRTIAHQKRTGQREVLNPVVKEESFESSSSWSSDGSGLPEGLGRRPPISSAENPHLQLLRGLSFDSNGPSSMVLPPAPICVVPQRKLENLSVDSFDYVGMLGKGSFGRVYLAQHRSSKYLYAVKRMSKRQQIACEQVKHAITENQIMKQLDHPFIIRHFGSYSDTDYLYIVMERIVGTSLYDVLLEVHQFKEEIVQFLAAQIVLMLEYLHGLGIVYRDLKPENILLNQDGFLKLIDMGFAKKTNEKTFTFCGSPCFIAPELILRNGYGQEVDWWALGVMIHEMIRGELPVDRDNLQELLEAILTEELEFDEEFSDEARDLLSRLLAKDPSQRLGTGPSGAEDVKSHPFFHNINWTALAAKTIRSPFDGIESLRHGLDPFDESELSDEEALEDEDEPLTAQQQALFDDF